MATNDTPDVAAKMIGAQLQSLLKIPPIQKKDPPNEPEKKERPVKEPNSVQYPYQGRRTAEKENVGTSSKFLPPESASRQSNSIDSTDSIPRDRFGRPFQNLDRRGGTGGGGRNRDFQTAGIRRYNNAPSQHPREPEMDDARTTTNLNRNRIKMRGKGRNQSEGRYYVTGVFEQASVLNPAPKLPALPIKFEVKKPDPVEKSKPYERPPRFTSPNRDPRANMTLEQLLELKECPVDIKASKDVFHEDRLPHNVALWDALKMHSVTSLIGKQNSKFPCAKFYCVACNYHMDNLRATVLHILQERHYIAERLYFMSKSVVNSAPPSDEHTSYLTDLILKTSKLEGLNQTERNQRIDLVAKLNEAMKAKNIDCQAVLFGSTVSGFGLRKSNVNINIVVGNEGNQLPTMENGSDQQLASAAKITGPSDFSGIMGKLVDIIKVLPNVKKDSVKEVYTTKCVSIHFYEEKVKAQCVVHFNNSSAVLAAELFAEYDKFDSRVRPLILCFRYLAKLMDIDDPEKGFLPPHCYAIMVIHFLQSRKFILPVLNCIPHIPDKPFATADHAKKNWTSPLPENGTASVGLLWLELLKYWAIDFNFKDLIVSMSRENRTILKDEKQWNRKINIEDPIIPKSNLSRSVTTYKLYDYIIEKFKIACHYFWMPRNKSGPLYDGLLSDSMVPVEKAISYVVPVRPPTSSEALQKMVRQIQKDKVLHNASPLNETKELKIPAFEIIWGKKKYLYIRSCDSAVVRDVLYKNDCHYSFKVDNFNDGSLPPIICKSCGAEGHLRATCPEEAVPPFLPVSLPSAVTLSKLNTAININFARESIDRHDLSVREAILREVKALLQPSFPSVSLTLFGSSLNGFGMHSSDVDICFTLNSVIVPPGERGIRLIEVAPVLSQIESCLKVNRRIRDILTISSAKVPIVKFVHDGHKIDGDVSLYNRLSIYNTNLLKAYVDLDDRVAPLGLFLKKVVKLCRIGDASKGSLSSYCYILMLIHFLQNHNPPVLPVLQELEYTNPPGPSKSVMHCDGYCVEFERDVNAVKANWPGYAKNKESCSHLWLAFLNYYVEKFDHEKYVITISQSKPLTRLEKCWHTDGLAIEDPFDKSHNLGGGLSRRMSVHIIKTLQRCRMFYHQPLDADPVDQTLTQHYLNADVIDIGDPPIDRQCRICCRIGHIARNCTYRYEVEGMLKDRDESVARGNNQSNDRTRPLETRENFPELSEQVTFKENIRPQLPPPVSTEAYGDSLSANDPAVVMCSKLPNGSAGVLSGAKSLGSDSDKNILNLFKNQSLFSVPVAETVKNTPDLESPTKAEVKPIKEVVFFGDIGGANAERERIQAMLQKNEGVTFTFDLKSQSPNSASENLENRGPFVCQPPPGFCSPNTIPVNHTAVIQRGLPYMTDQMHNPMIPIPISQPPLSVPYGHGPALGLPFPAPIPIENRPVDSRNGEATDRQGAPAPPPGFAPIPATNGIMPPEVAQNYPPAYSGGPNQPIGAPPMPVSFQQPNGFSSSPAPNTPIMGEHGMAYRMEPVDAPSAPPQQPGMAFEIGPPPVSNPMMMPPPMIHPVSMHQPVSVYPGLNRVIPNGHPDIQDQNVQQPPPPFMKPGPVTVEHGYSSDFGSGMMQPHTNPPMVSYGLSLSQAHHAPVVSALQMHHSQHHSPVPIQGNHFHPPVRPYMMSSYYAYPPPPPVQAPTHIHEPTSMPLHSGDPAVWK